MTAIGKKTGIAIIIWCCFNLVLVAGILIFWWRFYYTDMLDKEQLTELIPNFYGYYAWETSFTAPDIVLALMLTLAALILLKNPLSSCGKMLMTYASGALFFLTMLDLNYVWRNQIYLIPNSFTQELSRTVVLLLLASCINAAMLLLLERAGKKP